MTLGGINPLARMYAVFSDNVHAPTDQECLDASRELKEHFDFKQVESRPITASEYGKRIQLRRAR
jgi:hypothetical protein